MNRVITARELELSGGDGNLNPMPDVPLLRGDLNQLFGITLTVDKGGCAAKNSWEGDVTIAGTADDFIVTYKSVPQDVCVSTISGAGGWTRIVSGGQAIQAVPAATNDIAFTAS